jgi:hypothetical protein
MRPCWPLGGAADWLTRAFGHDLGQTLVGGRHARVRCYTAYRALKHDGFGEVHALLCFSLRLRRRPAMDVANCTAANRETAARFTIALPSRGATAWMVEALVRRTDSTFEPPPWMHLLLVA